MSDKRMQEFTPPNNLDAEKSLLGSILLNSKILDEVADKIDSEYFYDRRHQTLYKIIMNLWSMSKPVDTVFVMDMVKNSKTLSDQEKSSIDKEFLVELISKASLSSSPIHTSKIIKEKYALRSLISSADKIRQIAMEETNTVEEVLEQAQKSIYEISLDNVSKDFYALDDLLMERFESISSLSDGVVENPAVPTGFVDIDKLLGGLHASDLIILAARPSMGKTSFSLELMKRVAMKSNVGVAIFSLEMSKEQLVDKLISSTSGVNLRKIRDGQLSGGGDAKYDMPGSGFAPKQDDMEKLGRAIGALNECPIWIDDAADLTVTELRTKARRLKSRHNVGLIIIDYLQLMKAGGNYNNNRVLEVSEISRSLKMLSKELNIPIIALSQLSRGVEGRDDKRPMLSDLRDSGSIEQDADIVMFVHREEMYNKNTNRKGVADIIVAKHRNGETGSVELAWIGHLATFGDLQGARMSHVVNK